MKQNALDNIGNLDRLPRLPQVMVKILEVCRQDEIDPDELIRIISADTGLTARLMQILNSAWINLNKEIHSIESAVLYLGIESVKNLAISMSVMQVFDSEKSLAGFDMNRFWYDSFKCGVMSRKIAETTACSHPDEAFLAGLMHDIGKLVLWVNHPEEYREVLSKAENARHLTALEKDHFNLTCAELGGWLCQQWHFSPMISDAVLYVNDAIERVQYAAFPLVKIVFAANQLCSMADPAGDVEESDTLFSLIEMDGVTLTSVIGEVETEVLKMAESLGLRVPSQIVDAVVGGQCPGDDGNGDGVKDAIAAQLVEDALKSGVRDLSMLYGTLENLLHASDTSSVTDALDMGLKILFGVSSVFYFFCDHENKILTGSCNNKDKRHRIVGSIAVSRGNGESLLVKSLMARKMLNSLSLHDDEKPLAISDVQIMRLLACDVMFSLPMCLPEKNVGVIAIGLDQGRVPNFIQGTEMLVMLAKLAAVSLDRLQYCKESGHRIQRERAGAASQSMRKVIHEINNPLLIITSYLKMLSLKLPDRHPAQKELSVIEEEMARIDGLVRKLSLLSTPPVEQFKWVDIPRLYTSLLGVVKKSLLIPRGIDVDIVVEPDFPRVKTDKNGLKQIFINLLKNASEAMVKGGRISIRLKRVPGSVKIMVDERKKTAGAVEIFVRDTGPGIPGEIKAHLFEPYNSLKKGNNAGLGLSIVNTIVENINGTIACHTKENVGTEFKIVLPVASSPGALSLMASTDE